MTYYGYVELPLSATSQTSGDSKALLSLRRTPGTRRTMAVCCGVDAVWAYKSLLLESLWFAVFT